MKRVLAVDIAFDLICPWCLIGLRNLQRALALLAAEAPAVDVQLHWHGVQLLPDVPPAGWPFEPFYVHRLGSVAAMRARQGVVKAAADVAGVRIDYARINVMPNTADAHRVFAYAARHASVAQRDALLERLLRGYFEDGDNLGDTEVLLAHVEACGLDRATLAAQLRGAAVPFTGTRMASGVPAFSFDGGIDLGGAQPPEVLLDAMREALQRTAVPV